MGDAFTFADGRFHCPFTLYPAAAGAPVLIVLPALGVAARKYQALAQALMAAGHNVLVADWPGQGASRPQPNRRLDYGYRALLDEFVPKLLAAAAQHFPGSAPVLLGHSLGGHIATLYAAAHPQSGVKVIGVACGNIHYRHWRGLRRLLTPSAALLFNLLSAVLGYLPGKSIGFGGQEARRLMRDWGRVAWCGHFRHLGLPLAPAASNPTASLYLSIDNDPFAPLASTRGLAELIQDPPQVLRLSAPDTLPGNPHSAWLKAPQEVAGRIRLWLADA